MALFAALLLVEATLLAWSGGNVADVVVSFLGG